MLSDILFEAGSVIEKCERNMPDIYRPLAGEIAVIRTVIDCLRLYLDSFPSSDEHERLMQNFRESLLNVDLVKLVTARNQLLGYVQTVREKQSRLTDSANRTH